MTYRLPTRAESLAEKRQMYDKGIILARLNGYNIEYVALRNAVCRSTVRRVLRKYGTTFKVGRWWRYHVTADIDRLDISLDDLRAVGAHRRGCGWICRERSATALPGGTTCRRQRAEVARQQVVLHGSLMRP